MLTASHIWREGEEGEGGRREKEREEVEGIRGWRRRVEREGGWSGEEEGGVERRRVEWRGGWRRRVEQGGGGEGGAGEEGDREWSGTDKTKTVYRARRDKG